MMIISRRRKIKRKNIDNSMKIWKKKGNVFNIMMMIEIVLIGNMMPKMSTMMMFLMKII